MRLAVVLVALAATHAHAEITKLGDFSLGQQLAKPPVSAKITLYGCKGSVRPEIDRTKKIKNVTFSGDSCANKQATIAAITKEFGGAPIANADGDQLWEGKTASVIFSESISPSGPTIMLVAPGPGAKRTCFADDGWAAFWKTFQAAVAAGKPDAIAATFAFPVKNFEDKVVIKDAKALAGKKLFDAAAAKELANGKLTASCKLDNDEYVLQLTGSYSELTAKRVKGDWRWVSANSSSPD